MDPTALAAWLDDAIPYFADQHVSGVTELDGGWESDVYGFELNHSHGIERLVVRLYAGDNGSAKARHEFTGMAKLHAHGYPVPLVLAAEQDSGPLGRPFMVMEWVDGVADRSWPDVVEGPDFPAFVALLTRLHGLSWRQFTLDPDPSARQTIAMWETLFGFFPGLGFEESIDWLRDHVAQIEPLGPTVIHWDFHVGNVLVTPDGATHVVDWTQIAVTDPRFDVAWTELLLTMAIDTSAAQAFRTEYERQTRPLADMEFFETAAAIKRLFSVAVSLREGPESLGMRPEAADRMRRDLQTLAIPNETFRSNTGLTIDEIDQLIP